MPEVIRRAATIVFVFILIFCSFASAKGFLKQSPAAGNEVDKDHNGGHDQQDINKPADHITGDKPQQP